MQIKYSLQDISRFLEIEYSTLRYYEINFKDFFSSPFNIIANITYNKEDMDIFNKIHCMISGINCRKHSIDDVKSILMPSSKNGTVVAIASGKGGVGKTTITCNIAVCLAEKRKKVLIFDADLGLSNVHIHLGTNPKYNISDVLLGKKEITDIIEKTEVGIDIVPGGSGITSVSNLSFKDKLKIKHCLSQLKNEYDIIFFDIGAGISDNVMFFSNLADYLLLVTSSDLAAITDAYAFIKVSLSKNINKEMFLLINSVKSKREADLLYFRLKGCLKKFLNLDINNFYWVYSTARILKSIGMRKPLSYFEKEGRYAKQLNRIAEDIFNKAILKQKQMLV